MQESVRVVYLDPEVLIIEKPAGMPSQPDPSGDISALDAGAAVLRDMGEPSALWPVHRLDRVVGGLLAFARTKAAAAELSALVAGEGGMGKIYLAVCHGSAPEGELTDYIYKDSAAHKAYVVRTARRGAREARLTVRRIAERDGMSLVAVRLATGRFHQIRVQLASRGNPLVGDKKYGSRDAHLRVPALYAARLGFAMRSGERIALSMPPCDSYPWALFDINETDVNV